MSSSYLLLKIGVLIVPELDASLSVEQPSFDGLEALLVHGAPETETIKLGGDTGPFSHSVPPRSLRRNLFRSHFLLEMNNRAKWNQNVKNGDLRAAKLVNPVSLCFLNEGEEFFGAETFPLPLFNPLHAEVARPGKLTCIFFGVSNKYGFLRVGVRLLEPPQGRLGIQYLL